MLRADIDDCAIYDWAGADECGVLEEGGGGGCWATTSAAAGAVGGF